MSAFVFSIFIKSCSRLSVVWTFRFSVAPLEDTAVYAQILLDNKWSSFSSETLLPFWWLRQSKQLHFCRLFCPILRKKHSCKKIKINQGPSIQLMSLLSFAFSTELYCVTDSELPSASYLESSLSSANTTNNLKFTLWIIPGETFETSSVPILVSIVTLKILLQAKGKNHM